MTVKHLFIMDPIGSVQIDKDSTFALMWEAQRRGHLVLYAELSELYLRGGSVRCRAQPVRLVLEQGRHAELDPLQDIALAEVDLVWMRKDPPYDMAYVFAAQLLDLAMRETVVLNAPQGLLTMSEKVWALNYPELVPETLVTQSQGDIRAFAEEHGTIVVKPLDGNGGEAVFVLRQDDPNRGVILEVSTQHGATKVMAQRYVPEAVEGDKRIILIDGEFAGAVLRVPRGVDHRCNMHAGAGVEKTTLSARDRLICETLGPDLRALGQVFVGIDVIGGWLTEVNVTSPTGIHEINALDDVRLEVPLIDAALRRLG